MNENLKRHLPDIMAIGEGKALAIMPEDPMGVWCHIQEVRDPHNAEVFESAGFPYKCVVATFGLMKNTLERNLNI